MPRTRTGVRRHGKIHGARSLAHDSRARDRRVADCLGRPESSGHSRHDGLRRRHAVARFPRKDRDWILFTEEQPQVPVYAGFTPAETRRALKRKMEPSYMGTFTGARSHVLQTFANTHSALMKKRVAHYMISSACPPCHGKRLRPEALSVKFEGHDIGEISRCRWSVSPIPESHSAAGSPRHGASSVKKSRGHPSGLRGDPGPPGNVLLSWVSGISRSIAAHPRCHRVNCRGCGSPPRFAPTCSASCMCSMSHRLDCTRRILRLC